MGKVIDLDEIDRIKHEEEASHYRLSRSKSSVKKIWMRLPILVDL